MKKFDFYTCLILFTIGIFTRTPLVEQVHSHWDGADHAIAVIRYTFEQFTPTPPGYPLYIAAGKLFNVFIEDPHKSLLAVNVFASGISAALIYLLSKTIFDKKVGIVASLIFLSGSTFYYFGLTAHPYILLPTLYTSIVYFVYRIYIQKRQESIMLGIVAGISFGIRPQEILLFAPLILLGFFSLHMRNKIKFILFFTITTLTWLIPLIYTVGGIQKFINFNLLAASLGFPHRTINHNIELMIKGFLLSFGLSVFFPIILFITKFPKFKFQHKLIRLGTLFAAWMIPAFIFNLFIRTEQAGYQMGYITASLFLIAYSIWILTRKNILFYILSLLIIVIFNLYWFFFDRDPNYTKPYRPVSFHYSDIRKNDLKTGAKINYIKNNFDSERTYLIAADVLWKPYSYYLKDFTILALSSLESNQPPHSLNRYFGNNWNMRHEVQKEFTFVLPKEINKVIIMDDRGFEWVRNKNKKKIELQSNSILTVVEVLPKTTMFYGYQKILFKR